MKKIFMPQGAYQVSSVRLTEREGTDDIIIDFFDGEKLVALVEADRTEFLTEMTKLFIGGVLKDG